jgi:hypothetical protein
MGRIVFLMVLVSIGFVSCKSNYTRIGDKDANYIPYYLKVYEADSLYLVGDYEQSYQILDSLFKRYEPIQMRNYYELTSYFKLKVILNKKIKFIEFSKLISDYNVTEVTIKNDSLLSIYYQKEKQKFEINYKNLRDEFTTNLNLSLRNDIKKMNSDDQLFRKKGSSNYDKQRQLDSINSKKLVAIFTKYGYPNEYLIGNSMVDGTLVEIGTLLLHTNNKERLDYFMPIVLDYIYKGIAPPIEYAYMKDQYLLYNGQKQYYGSYDMNFEEIGTNLHELNLRRKSIGLPSYGYEDWRFKTLYPKDFEEQQEFLKKIKADSNQLN